MRRILTYAVLCVAMLAAADSCTDYGSRLDDLRHKLEQYEQQRQSVESGAASLKRLIDAVQAADELLSFAPIAASGAITGYKLTFKQAGEVTVYNQATGIGVARQDGRYYWTTAGGKWLLDASGNKIEITPRAELPIFKTEGGQLCVSTDGGEHWQELGAIDKALIESVVEDALQVEITLSGGAVLSIPKPRTIRLSLSSYEFSVKAGESIALGYETSGAEGETQINVLCGDGWRAVVSPETETSGTIILEAGANAGSGPVIVFAGDGQGMLVQAQILAEVSRDDDPPVPGPGPDPATILVPSRKTCFASSDGGQITVPVFANVDYEVASDASWVHFTGVKAVRKDELLFSIDPNTGSTRTATVTLTSGNYSSSFAIVQNSIEFYVNISKKDIRFTSDGGTVELYVSANTEYRYESSGDWFELEELESQTPGVASFAVRCGTYRGSELRGGSINFFSESVGIQTVVVSQEAYVPPPPDPVIVPAQDIIEVGAEGGLVQMQVYSNTSYSVTVNGAWAKYEGFDAATPGTLLFDVEPNISGGRSVSVYLRSEKLTASFVIQQASGEHTPQNLPTLVSYVMPCCRVHNRGTTFLVNGSWTATHSYGDLSQVLDIFQKIKDAGINVVCVDFSNASQWDDYGESALHNGDGGEFWRQFGPMIDVIVEACRAKEMKFFFLIGNITTAGGISYWNGIARRIWENWAQLDVYQRYGYGDDRPLMVCFLPGTTYASTLRRASAANKNYLEKFRVGTCQINSPITPTATDGWGYRNYSGSSDGKVRFACPNSGVPPSDWARVDDAEWKRRVKWALGASEYAILGSYDDTCDAIFWGIADVSHSYMPYHSNAATSQDPFIYYNIVRRTILGLD